MPRHHRADAEASGQQPGPIRRTNTIISVASQEPEPAQKLPPSIPVTAPATVLGQGPGAVKKEAARECKEEQEEEEEEGCDEDEQTRIKRLEHNARVRFNRRLKSF